MQIRLTFDTEKDDCSGLRELLSGKLSPKRVTRKRSRRKAGELPTILKAFDTLSVYAGATNLTTEEAAEVLRYANSIKAWLSSISNQVQTAIENGEEVEGWKVVDCYPRRAIINNFEAMDALEQAGISYNELIQDYSKFSIPKLEERLGEDTVARCLKGNVDKPFCGRQVVPESDKRPAVVFK